MLKNNGQDYTVVMSLSNQMGKCQDCAGSTCCANVSHEELTTTVHDNISFAILVHSDVPLLYLNSTSLAGYKTSLFSPAVRDPSVGTNLTSEELGIDNITDVRDLAFKFIVGK